MEIVKDRPECAACGKVLGLSANQYSSTGMKGKVFCSESCLETGYQQEVESPSKGEGEMN